MTQRDKNPRVARVRAKESNDPGQMQVAERVARLRFPPVKKNKSPLTPAVHRTERPE